MALRIKHRKQLWPPASPFLTSNNGWHKRALILMQRTATTLPNDEGATGQVAAATAASGCALQCCPSLSHNLEAALLTWPPPFALRAFQYASSCFKALAQLLCLQPSFVSSECSLPMHVVTANLPVIGPRLSRYPLSSPRHTSGLAFTPGRNI